ncbi:tail tape measure protein [Sphingomonas quercus]|uniref:Tail tape measure protein n=1 Tax=Sphingomonas quercus TaxID=2842451 RepID=A0ABS6BJI1_9SPHN|nr:tail tape measure protein [Sphingomonas quercus]MBU3078465.1 tail tape measure protein [Sphingomonas quercus]
MDEELERMVVRVNADLAPFQRDCDEMKRMLDSGVGKAGQAAGRLIEAALGQAIRTGKFGFEDLKRIALAAMSDVARAAISNGLGSVLNDGGLVSTGTRLIGAALGLPGRATGGPVTQGRAYMVGERGPELFVPTSSGRVEGAAGGATRSVNVAISIGVPAGSAPDALARSGRQVARAVRRALDAAER